MAGRARARVFQSAALVCVALAACVSAAPPSAPQQPAVCGAPRGGSTQATSLAAAETTFAVALYGRVAAGAAAGQNLVVSPYSVSSTMAMLDVGAEGETAAQIQAVLHLPDTGPNVAPSYAELACEDETDASSQGNRLAIANSIWGQQGKSFEPGFLSALATGYGAPLQQVDFAGDPNGALLSINQWVSDETQGMIPMLLQPPEIGASTQLVLVNAMYFAGAWDVAFDPRFTTMQPFVLSDGTTTSVATMSGLVNVGEGGGGPGAANDATAVYELPYRGGTFVIDFVVPPGSLSALEGSLTPDGLQALLASVGTPFHAAFWLPKFSFGTHIGLAPLLGAMGMPDVFDATKADLSGFDGAKDLSVGAVVHEATVHVDEQGTVATATTSTTLVANDVPPQYVINHPFLFIIRDKRNGSILFMGRIEDPTKGG
jgi:serpin B